MGHVILQRMVDDAGLSDDVRVSSSGTGDWHVGEHADPRTVEVLARHGYDGSRHRAREFDPDEFDEFDLILASDEGHVRTLQPPGPRAAPPRQDPARARVRPRRRGGRHPRDGRPVVRRSGALRPVLRRGRGRVPWHPRPRQGPAGQPATDACAPRGHRARPDPMRDVNLTVPDYPYGSPCWVDLLVSDVRARPDLLRRALRLAVARRRPRDRRLHDGAARRPSRRRHQPQARRRPDPRASGRPTCASVTSRSPSAPSTRYGGRTLGRPVAIGALSRTLIAVDPGGSYFGVWEPGDLPGSGVLDEPGSLTWNELLTRDYDRVQNFQLGVFGHEFTDETEPGGPRWATAHTGDGNPAYGLAEIDDEWPREIPPHWVASFATRDVVPAPGAGARPRRHAAPGPLRRPLRCRRRAERARGRGLLAPRARPRLTRPTSPDLLANRLDRRPQEHPCPSTRRPFAPGTPCWADVMVDDLDARARLLRQPLRLDLRGPAARGRRLRHGPQGRPRRRRRRWPRTRTTPARSARGRSTSRPTTSTPPRSAPGRPVASSSSGRWTCSRSAASPSAPTRPARPTACGRPRSTRAPTSSTSPARSAGPSR